MDVIRRSFVRAKKETPIFLLISTAAEHQNGIFSNIFRLKNKQHKALLSTWIVISKKKLTVEIIWEKKEEIQMSRLLAFQVSYPKPLVFDSSQ